MSQSNGNDHRKIQTMISERIELDAVAIGKSQAGECAEQGKIFSLFRSVHEMMRTLSIALLYRITNQIPTNITAIPANRETSSWCTVVSNSP